MLYVASPAASMLVSQGRCDVIILSHARDDAGSGMKYTLETIDRTVR